MVNIENLNVPAFIAFTIILILVAILRNCRHQIKALKEDLRTLERELKKRNSEYSNLESNLNRYKSATDNLLPIINKLIKGKILIYSKSKFHSNYSRHNGKFFAKVLETRHNNKACGIPVISINKDTYVINLYELRKLLQVNKVYNHIIEIEAIIKYWEDCTIKKDQLRLLLGDKDLSNYR